MPTAAIGADVMVGFPGETEFEFEGTRRMIEDLPFTYLHVFTFSARPGTPAASMANQVPVHLARERNRVLRELAAEKKLAFMRSFIGQELAAITLNVTTEDADGPWTEALTDNYLKLRLRGKHGANRWVNTRVTAVEDGALIAIGDNSSEIANLGLNSMVLERTDAGRFESVDGQSGSSDIRGFNEHSSVGAAELSPAL
jgi:threonylcarbamoyladenosine tRNA methylthiotransferase MtaB